MPSSHAIALGLVRRDAKTPYPTWVAIHDEHGGITDTTLGASEVGVILLHECACGATYREAT